MRLDKGQLIIKIDLGNDAMSKPEHIADILYLIADKFSTLKDRWDDDGDWPELPRRFKDVNGNSCASLEKKTR